MILVIDAYNVLKSQLAPSSVTATTAQWFVKTVSGYARSKKHEAIIVFDGGQSSFPARSTVHGVSVIYSGYRTTADDVIKKLLHENEPALFLMVSSDRELCMYAEYLGIVSMDSSAFYGLLREYTCPDIHKKKASMCAAQKRPGYESSADLDALMCDASCKILRKDDDQSDDEDEWQQQRRQGTKKESKIERRLVRVVKKL